MASRISVDVEVAGVCIPVSHLTTVYSFSGLPCSSSAAQVMSRHVHYLLRLCLVFNGWLGTGTACLILLKILPGLHLELGNEMAVYILPLATMPYLTGGDAEGNEWTVRK